MKKLVILLFSVAMLFATDTNQKIVDGINKNAEGGVAGTMVFAIHGAFWIPVVLFIVVVLAIPATYIKFFKQQQEGATKVVISIIVAFVVGSYVYTWSLAGIVDSALDSKGCGSEFATAYIKDGIKKATKGSSYSFYTEINKISCLK